MSGALPPLVTLCAYHQGMRVLVVDDEPPALSELTYLLERDGRFSKVMTAGSGTDALRALESHDIDVVFSDISMPGLDGMELARVIARFARRPQVVFVTAHDEYAVDAFAVQATDYVMKPVHPQRLAQAVDRVLAAAREEGEAAPTLPAGSNPANPSNQAVAPQPQSLQPQSLQPQSPQQQLTEQPPQVSSGDKIIPVERAGVTRFLKRSAIRYVQAQGDYARLFTHQGSHLIRVPLSTLEQRWAEAGFVRIHRSTLVSLTHVAQVRQAQGKLTVVLDGDGTELAVSRRHSREVRERMLARGPDQM